MIPAPSHRVRRGRERLENIEKARRALETVNDDNRGIVSPGKLAALKVAGAALEQLAQQVGAEIDKLIEFERAGAL